MTATTAMVLLKGHEHPRPCWDWPGQLCTCRGSVIGQQPPNHWGQQDGDRKTKSQEACGVWTSGLPVLTVSVLVTLVPHAW